MGHADHAEIERAFVRLDEGQVHLRRLPAADPGATPLLICHASPASSWFMQGLMLALREAGHRGEIIAPDTLGNGDSPPPAGDEPDMAYFSASMDRMCDALGLGAVDAYGTHTGARIVCELAAGHPGRVRRLVLDGITEYADDLREAVIANYAPVVEPDEYGRHLIWAFNFVRDQSLFFPHFMKKPEQRLAVPIPSPDVLHRATLDVLKALGTYSKPYLAAFRYRAYERMPLVSAPTLLLKAENELALLNQSVATALGLLPNGRAEASGPAPADKARIIAAFLEG